MDSNFIHVVPAVGQLKWIVIGLGGAWAEIFPTMAEALARAASRARIESGISGDPVGVRSRDLQGNWLVEKIDGVLDETLPLRPAFYPGDTSQRRNAWAH